MMHGPIQPLKSKSPTLFLATFLVVSIKTAWSGLSPEEFSIGAMVSLVCSQQGDLS